MKKLPNTKALVFTLLSLPFLSYANDDNSQDIEVSHNKEQQVSDEDRSLKAVPTHESAYFKKLAAEKESGFNHYVMTPHKMTYFLPISISDNMNREIYDGLGQWGQEIQSFEAKFQFSIKVPLSRNDVFTKGDAFHFGFTLQSWWQLYNQKLSRPFRETNYQPEIFYTAPMSWKPLGGDTNSVIGFEHQSNGRTQLYSRSWNRLYYTFTFAKDNYAVSFRPWYRIPEGDKETTIFESGNDNIDITDYMGHFDLTFLYKWQSVEMSLVGRRNFKEQHGGLELGVTFPISGKLKGYFQFTHGYGESLIDYNHSQNTVGLGIALTELF